MVIHNSNKSIKQHDLFRGAYSKLNLYFQNAVNCYYEHTNQRFQKDSTVMVRANAGTWFSLYLQENQIGSFGDIKESDVIDHL